MSLKERIPVYLLTGFLGSGKTTLLNSLVKQPGMERSLILINEFGEVGLDHLLVSHAKEDDNLVVELGSGCLCCATRGDFAKTLRDTPWRYARDGQPLFDRVIIETTGLADPTSIIQTLMRDRTIHLQFRLQGVVTAVDAVNGASTITQHIEARKQVSVADLLLVTKADLNVEKHTLDALLQQLAERNPTADIQMTNNGTVAANLILQLDHIEPADSSIPLKKWLNISSVSAQPTGKNLKAFAQLNPISEPQNDINRHNDHIQAHCFIFDEPLSEAKFGMWVDIMVPLFGKNLLRLKGIINIQGHAGPVVIHGVQHTYHPAAYLPEWPDDDRRSKLVFITYDIDRQTLERTFEVFKERNYETEAKFLSEAQNEEHSKQEAISV